jgi:hypothetical protein
VEVRSYGRVFDLERRLYRVDRLRLNPSGVPLRGVAYLLVLLLASLVLAGMPVLGTALRLLPWYLRDGLMPAALATLFASMRVEGRTFHLAVLAFARLDSRPLGRGRHGRRGGERWHPGELFLIPDGSDARQRAFLYTGPGSVRLAVAHQCSALDTGLARARVQATVRRRRVAAIVKQVPGPPLSRRRAVLLAPGTRLLVERE